MVRRGTAGRAGMVAWVVCALLLVLLVSSPHCDACDGAARSVVHRMLTGTGQATVQAKTMPVAPDGCNGVCACCALVGVPVGVAGVRVLLRVVAVRVTEPVRAGLVRPSSLFRPPRRAGL